MHVCVCLSVCLSVCLARGTFTHIDPLRTYLRDSWILLVTKIDLHVKLFKVLYSFSFEALYILYSISYVRLKKPNFNFIFISQQEKSSCVNARGIPPAA